MLQVISMYRRLVVAMNPQSARACPELRANGGVVSGGVVPEREEAVVVGGRKDKGLLGEDRDDGSEV